MKIVADENIPLLNPFFGNMGDIVTLPGREINQEHLADADLLIVRSVTPVDRSLLEGTPVKFVGTTTIGLDHIDVSYLKEQGIGFCSAPGCNASAVVEYVVGALSVLAEQLGFTFEDKSIGIVGRGEIGSRLENVVKKLGMKVKSNDPPRQAAGEEELYSLEEVLACDVVTLHVPLSDGGLYPTRHLLSEGELSQLNNRQILINSSRGDVIDENALKERLNQPDAPTVVLDVFKNEPLIDIELANLCHFITPHIAGYTLDGKTNGTDMVYRQVCRFLGLPVRHKVGQFMPEPPLRKLAFSSEVEAEWALHTAIRACYDIRHDDSNLRRVIAMSKAKRAESFDRLRKQYRVRRGFEQVKIILKGGKADLINTLSAVGFNIQSK